MVGGVHLGAPSEVFAVRGRIRIHSPDRTQLVVPAPRTLVAQEMHRAVLDDRNQVRRTARGAPVQRLLEKVVLAWFDLVVRGHHALHLPTSPSRRGHARNRGQSHTHRGARHSEFRYGSLLRCSMMSESAKESDVHATYKDGILEIRVPMEPEPEVQPKAIPVERVVLGVRHAESRAG